MERVPLGRAGPEFAPVPGNFLRLRAGTGLARFIKLWITGKKVSTQTYVEAQFEEYQSQPVMTMTIIRKLTGVGGVVVFGEMVIAGCDGRCHFDSFRCAQWREFYRNDDISGSIMSLIQLLHQSYRLSPVGQWWDISFLNRVCMPVLTCLRKNHVSYKVCRYWRDINLFIGLMCWCELLTMFCVCYAYVNWPCYLFGSKLSIKYYYYYYYKQMLLIVLLKTRDTEHIL